MRAFRSNWRSLDLTKRPLSYTAAKDLMHPKGYPVIHGYVSSQSTSPQPEGLPWDLQRTCRHSCVFCFSLLKVHCSNIPYHSASSRSEGCCFVDATVHEIHETLGEMRQHNLSGASKSSCNTGRFLEIDTYLSYLESIYGDQWIYPPHRSMSRWCRQKTCKLETVALKPDSSVVKFRKDPHTASVTI